MIFCAQCNYVCNFYGYVVKFKYICISKKVKDN